MYLLPAGKITTFCALFSNVKCTLRASFAAAFEVAKEFRSHAAAFEVAKEFRSHAATSEAAKAQTRGGIDAVHK